MIKIKTFLAISFAFVLLSFALPTKTNPNMNGCSMSQGFWFASQNSVWPVSGVTIGGHTYTEIEAKAIWNNSNSSGIQASKKGFCQVAAIKLSGTVGFGASVWAEVAIVEGWLSTLPKLSPTNLPDNNQAVHDAGGAIGNWIDTYHCTTYNGGMVLSGKDY